MNAFDRGWSAIPAWRTFINWLAFAVCAMLSMFALERLAHQQLTNHLDRTAGAILGALTHADTPHRWSARDESDLVAGKAFGTTDYSFDSRGLQVHSQGQAIEIGLVIPSAIDIRRFANFGVGIAGVSAGSLAVVVRSSLDSAVCASERILLQPGNSTVQINLRTLQWTCAGEPAMAPDRAEMLRLRFLLDQGTSLTLIDVEARTNQVLSAASLDQLQLPLLPSLQDPHAFERALDRASSDINGSLWPILQLSANDRVEQSLLARDLTEQRIADAVIVAHGHFPQVTLFARDWKPESKEVDRGRWSIWLLGIYALLLLWIRLKPASRPRLRALLELLGVTAVPIALIAGDAIADNIDRSVLVAGAMTLAFGLSLLIGGAPEQPGARAMKRGWWVSLLSIALAFAIVLGTTGQLPVTLPNFPRVLHYLVWAAVLQFIICVIVAERIERIIGSALWAVFGAALVFALLTTPNAMLMQLSFAGGLIWVWNWQRHRALLANIVAHTVCALLLVTSLPVDWLYSGEVGARFFLN